MKNSILFVVLSITTLLLSACFKDTPKNEMFKVAGSWKVDKVEITKYDVSGNEIANQTISESGFILFSHVDDFLYEGTYSYSLDATKLSDSKVYDAFKFCNQWGVTNGMKVLNVSKRDLSTNYSELYVAYTITKCTNNTLIFRFIELQADNSTFKRIEEWKLKRANS